MTKDRWHIVRKLDEIPMDVWFEFYREKGGSIGDIVEFERLFTMLLWSPSNITLDSALRKLYNYYDEIER